MPPNSRIIPYLLLSVFLSGCAANDLLAKRQSESEAKTEYLLQTSKKVEQRQNELIGVQQSQDEKLQAFQRDIKQLREENRTLKTSSDELAVRVAWLVQQTQTPKVQIVNQPSSPKTVTESDPPADYISSFGLYSANNFAMAIKSFESFLKNNPQSDYSANAAYWIGECHYTLSDLEKAKEAFLKVTEVYPKSSKAPDALLKLGYTLSALKEKEKATAVFEKIITLYPSHPVAKKARERLSAH